MRFETLKEAQAAARALKWKGFEVSMLEDGHVGWVVRAWKNN
jgi:hypothetical protein